MPPPRGQGREGAMRGREGPVKRPWSAARMTSAWRMRQAHAPGAQPHVVRRRPRERGRPMQSDVPAGPTPTPGHDEDIVRHMEAAPQSLPAFEDDQTERERLEAAPPERDR